MYQLSVTIKRSFTRNVMPVMNNIFCRAQKYEGFFFPFPPKSTGNPGCFYLETNDNILSEACDKGHIKMISEEFYSHFYYFR